jgi:hypothetical protein
MFNLFVYRSRGLPTEDPEKLFAQRQKEQRARELEEIAQLRATTIAHNLWEETDAHERAESSRIQRARELQELANLRPKKNWNEVLASGASACDEVAFFCAEENAQESERQRRARELQDLASSRNKKNWSDAVIITEEEQPRLSNKTPDPELELEDAKVSIRSAAAAWQERDKASSANRSA